MAEKKNFGNHPVAGVTIQLHLLGIVVFSVALVLASALVTYGFVKTRSAGDEERGLPRLYRTSGFSGTVETEATNVPPWGQLVERDIDLEQPEEYVAYEISTNHAETWTFAGMNPAGVRTVMQSAGLAADQIQRALTPASMIYENSNTVVTPGAGLVLELSPQVRSRLYTVLGRFDENALMQFPFCFPGNTFATRVDKSKMSPATLAFLQATLYRRGNAQCFSDLGVLLHDIPEEQDRLRTVESLSHQSAVLLGIRVWPDSDVDKIMDYWSAPGVHLMDVRPLLNSLKHHPQGGAASILYFLPPFARQRLYTYPLPAQPGDPAMDCHWSTMNFFNATPDNRFSDPQYTVKYLLSHYYKIAQPGRYGDLIFLLNQNGDAIHSAVYLADDIVFTKNGNNAAQPWMLMHLKDLLAEYSLDGAPEVAVYRNREW